MNLLRPSVSIIIGSFAILFASYIGFMHPIANTVIFMLILTCIIIATWIKFEFGVLLAIWELMLGGHGYLFSIDLLGVSLSLRMAIFCIIAVFWLFQFFRLRKTPALFRTKIRIPFLLFLLFLLYGALRGFSLHQASIVYADANAYVAICYLVFFADALRKPIQKTRLFRFMFSVATALALITIAVSAIFSIFHYDSTLGPAASVDTSTYEQLSQIQSSGSDTRIGQRLVKSPGSLTLNPLDVTKTKPSTYRWLRDTGTAEITYVSGRFFRVFFPSHFFLALLLFPMLGVLRKQFFWKGTLPPLLTLFALLISFSRSLLAGMAMSIAVWLAYTVCRSRHRKIFVIVGIVLFLGVIFIAWQGATNKSFEVLDSLLHPMRTVSGAHRIELLRAIFHTWQQHPIIGSGFGTLVNFPTILPEGELIYTSFYVYEWAYFDIAVKLGTAGLLVFLIFILSILKYILGSFFSSRDEYTGGLFLGLITLTIANIFTPVFSHPLGLSALAIALMCTIPPFYEPARKNPIADRHVE